MNFVCEEDKLRKLTTMTRIGKVYVLLTLNWLRFQFESGRVDPFTDYTVVQLNHRLARLPLSTGYGTNGMLPSCV